MWGRQVVTLWIASSTHVIYGDLMARLHAFGCEQVTRVGYSQSGPSAISYAAKHPDRVTALVLIDTFAELTFGKSMTRWVFPPDALQSTPCLVLQSSGGQEPHPWRAHPANVVTNCSVKDSHSSNALAVVQIKRRRSPGSASCRMFDNSCRCSLFVLLVLHRRKVIVTSRRPPVDTLAEQIPAAKYVELPGDDHYLRRRRL